IAVDFLGDTLCNEIGRRRFINIDASAGRLAEIVLGELDKHEETSEREGMENVDFRFQISDFRICSASSPLRGGALQPRATPWERDWPTGLSAPKGHNLPAQGNALGTELAIIM